MRITRHSAPDMRQALRAVKEQLGPDAVILSSRRTATGVEITAAMDFDAEELRAAEALARAAENSPAVSLSVPTAHAAPTLTQVATKAGRTAAQIPARAAPAQPRAIAPVAQSTAAERAAKPLSQSASILLHATSPAARSQPIGKAMQSFAAETQPRPFAVPSPAQADSAQTGREAITGRGLHAQGAAVEILSRTNSAQQGREIIEAAQARVAALAANQARANGQVQAFDSHDADTHDHAGAAHDFAVQQDFPPQAFLTHAPRYESAPQEFDSPSHDEDWYARAGAGIPTAHPADSANTSASGSSSDLMGNELKTLRRMLETQLAQLAWNDLSRRAPVHTEMLRELTEIGLGPELAAHVVSQLPAHMDLTQARRLSIATLSQQVLVTGDRWLEDGGRVALVGPTGVGKTTTLAKLAVRWVLRHGPRDLAIVAGDGMRIGAHEQLNTLGQLLGARVYPLQNLEELPALLTKLSTARFVLIDTPGSSQRDAQLASRLDALTAVGPDLETALVLGASTQAGAIAEVVQRFASVNPASVVLTKIDEAASLGGVLSVLVRARLPISYMSEGQRVPEDLRPARSLELVSSAVQLAQTTGAAADEDLLRRRFGEMAHAIA